MRLLLVMLLVSCGKLPETQVDPGGVTRITSHSCAEVYIPVCGQPPMPNCPAGLACIQVMPAPKTYANDCLMADEGATLLSHGECP